MGITGGVISNPRINPRQPNFLSKSSGSQGNTRAIESQLPQVATNPYIDRDTLATSGIPVSNISVEREPAYVNLTFEGFIFEQERIGELLKMLLDASGNTYHLSDIDENYLVGFKVISEMQRVYLLIDFAKIANSLNIDTDKLIKDLRLGLYQHEQNDYYDFRSAFGLESQRNIIVEAVQLEGVLLALSSLCVFQPSLNSNLQAIRGRHNSSLIETFKKVMANEVTYSREDIIQDVDKQNLKYILLSLCLVRLGVINPKNVSYIKDRNIVVIQKNNKIIELEYDVDKMIEVLADTTQGFKIDSSLLKELGRGLDLKPLGGLLSKNLTIKIEHKLDISDNWNIEEVILVLFKDQHLTDEVKNVVSDIWSGKLQFVWEEGKCKTQELGKIRETTQFEYEVINMMIKLHSRVGLLFDFNSKGGINSLPEEFRDLFTYIFFGADKTIGKDDLIRFTLLFNKIVKPDGALDMALAYPIELGGSPLLREEFDYKLKAFLECTKILDESHKSERLLSAEEKIKARLLFYKIMLGLEEIKEADLKGGVDPTVALAYRMLRTGGSFLAGVDMEIKQSLSLQALLEGLPVYINDIIATAEKANNVKKIYSITINGLITASEADQTLIFKKIKEIEKQLNEKGLDISIKLQIAFVDPQPSEPPKFIIKGRAHYEYKPGFLTHQFRGNFNSGQILRTEDSLLHEVLLSGNNMDSIQVYTLAEIFDSYQHGVSKTEKEVFKTYFINAVKKIFVGISDEQITKLLDFKFEDNDEDIQLKENFLRVLGFKVSLVKEDRYSSDYSVVIMNNQSFYSSNFKDSSSFIRYMIENSRNSIFLKEDKRLLDLFALLFKGRQEVEGNISELVNLLSEFKQANIGATFQDTFYDVLIINALAKGEIVIDINDNFTLKPAKINGVESAVGKALLQQLGESCVKEYEMTFLRILMSPQLIQHLTKNGIFGENYDRNFDMVNKYLHSYFERNVDFEKKQYESFRINVAKTFGSQLVAPVSLDLPANPTLTEILAYDEIIAQNPLLCLKLSIYDRIMSQGSDEYAGLGISQLDEVTSSSIDQNFYHSLIIFLGRRIPSEVKQAIDSLNKEGLYFLSFNDLASYVALSGSNKNATILYGYLKDLYFQIMVKSAKYEYGGELQQRVLSYSSCVLQKGDEKSGFFYDKAGFLEIIRSVEAEDLERAYKQMLNRFPQTRRIFPEGFDEEDRDNWLNLFNRLSDDWNTKEVAIGESFIDSVAKLFIYELSNVISIKSNSQFGDNAMLFSWIFGRLPENPKSPFACLTPEDFKKLDKFYKEHIIPKLQEDGSISLNHPDLQFLALRIHQEEIDPSEVKRLESILFTLWERFEFNKLQETVKQKSLTRDLYQLARLRATLVAFEKYRAQYPDAKRFDDLPEIVKSKYDFKKISVNVSGNNLNEKQRKIYEEIAKAYGLDDTLLEKMAKDNAQELREDPTKMRNFGVSVLEVGKTFIYNMDEVVSSFGTLITGASDILEELYFSESELEREWCLIKLDKFLENFKNVLDPRFLKTFLSIKLIEAYKNKIVRGEDGLYVLNSLLQAYALMGFYSFMYGSLLKGLEHSANFDIQKVHPDSITFILTDGTVRTLPHREAKKFLDRQIADYEIAVGRELLIRRGYSPEVVGKYPEASLRRIAKGNLKLQQYSQAKELGSSLSKLYKKLTRGVGAEADYQHWLGRMTEAERLDAYARFQESIPTQRLGFSRFNPFRGFRVGDPTRAYISKGMVYEMGVEHDHAMQLKELGQKWGAGKKLMFFTGLLRMPATLLWNLGKATSHHIEVVEMQAIPIKEDYFDPDISGSSSVSLRLGDTEKKAAVSTDPEEKIYLLTNMKQEDWEYIWGRIGIKNENFSKRILSCLFAVPNRKGDKKFYNDYDVRLNQLLEDQKLTDQQKATVKNLLSFLRFRQNKDKDGIIRYFSLYNKLFVFSSDQVGVTQSNLELDFVKGLKQNVQEILSKETNTVKITDGHLIVTTPDDLKMEVTLVRVSNVSEPSYFVKLPKISGAHLPEIGLVIPITWMSLTKSEREGKINELMKTISQEHFELPGYRPSKVEFTAQEADKIYVDIFREESSVARTVAGDDTAEKSLFQAIPDEIKQALQGMHRFHTAQTYRDFLTYIKNSNIGNDTTTEKLYEMALNYELQHRMQRVGVSGDHKFLSALREIIGDSGELRVSQDKQGVYLDLIFGNEYNKESLDIEAGDALRVVCINDNGRMRLVFRLMKKESGVLKDTGRVIADNNLTRNIEANFNISSFPIIMMSRDPAVSQSDFQVLQPNQRIDDAWKGVQLEVNASSRARLEKLQKEADNKDDTNKGVHQHEIRFFGMSDSELSVEHERLKRAIKSKFDEVEQGKTSLEALLISPAYRKLQIEALALLQESMRRFYYEFTPFQGADQRLSVTSKNYDISRFFNGKLFDSNSAIREALVEKKWVEEKDGVFYFTQTVRDGVVTLQEIVDYIAKNTGLDTKKIVNGVRMNRMQIWASLALTEGRGNLIDEACGEGKTLVAIAASYVFSLTGRMSLVTSSDMTLAKTNRDFANTIYKFLTGDENYATMLRHDDSLAAKQAALAGGVVYSDGNVPMFIKEEDAVQKDPSKRVFLPGRGFFAIVNDEADYNLMIEDRVARILSGQDVDSSIKNADAICLGLDQVARAMLIDYQNSKSVLSLEVRGSKVMPYIRSNNREAIEFVLQKLEALNTPESRSLIKIINSAIKSGDQVVLYFITGQLTQSLTARLNDGERDFVVDNNNGKRMVGLKDAGTNISFDRKYSDGKHQAIEAMVINGRLVADFDSLPEAIKQVVLGNISKLGGESIEFSPFTSTNMSMKVRSYVPMFPIFSGMSGTNSSFATEFILLGMPVIVIPRANKFRMNELAYMEPRQFLDDASRQLAMESYLINRGNNGFEDGDAVQRVLAPFHLIIANDDHTATKYAKMTWWAELQRIYSRDNLQPLSLPQTLKIAELIADKDLSFTDFVIKVTDVLNTDTKASAAIVKVDVKLYVGRLSEEEKEKIQKEAGGADAIVIITPVGARGVNWTTAYTDAMKILSDVFLSDTSITYSRSDIIQILEKLISKNQEAKPAILKTLMRFKEAFERNITDTTASNDILIFLRTAINFNDNDFRKRRLARQSLAFRFLGKSLPEVYLRKAAEVMLKHGLRDPAVISLSWKPGVTPPSTLEGISVETLKNMLDFGPSYEEHRGIGYIGEIEMLVRLELKGLPTKVTFTEDTKILAREDARRMNSYYIRNDEQEDISKDLLKSDSDREVGEQVDALIKECEITGAISLRERFSGNKILGIGYNPLDPSQDHQAKDRVGRNGADGVAVFFSALDDEIFRDNLPGFNERGNYVVEILRGIDAIGANGEILRDNINYQAILAYSTKIRTQAQTNAVAQRAEGILERLEKTVWKYIEWQTKLLSAKSSGELLRCYAEFNKMVISDTYSIVSDEVTRLINIAETFRIPLETLQDLIRESNTDDEKIEILQNFINERFMLSFGNLRFAEINMDDLSRVSDVSSDKLLEILKQLKCLDGSGHLIKVPTEEELRQALINIKPNADLNVIINYLQKKVDHRLKYINQIYGDNNIPTELLLFFLSKQKEINAYRNAHGGALDSNPELEKIYSELFTFLRVFSMRNQGILRVIGEQNHFSETVYRLDDSGNIVVNRAAVGSAEEAQGVGVKVRGFVSPPKAAPEELKDEIAQTRNETDPTVSRTASGDDTAPSEDPVPEDSAQKAQAEPPIIYEWKSEVDLTPIFRGSSLESTAFYQEVAVNWGLDIPTLLELVKKAIESSSEQKIGDLTIKVERSGEIIITKGEETKKIMYQDIDGLAPVAFGATRQVFEILKDVTDYYGFLRALSIGVTGKAKDGELFKEGKFVVSRKTVNGNTTIIINNNGIIAEYNLAKIRDFLFVEKMLRDCLEGHKPETVASLIKEGILKVLDDKGQEVSVKVEANKMVEIPNNNGQSVVKIPEKLLIQLDNAVAHLLMQQASRTGPTAQSMKSIEDIVSEVLKQEGNIEILRQQNNDISDDEIIVKAVSEYMKAQPIATGVISKFVEVLAQRGITRESTSADYQQVMRGLLSTMTENQRYSRMSMEELHALCFTDGKVNKNGEKLISEMLHGSFISGMREDVTTNIAQAAVVYFILLATYKAQTGEFVWMNDYIFEQLSGELTATQSFFKMCWAKRLLHVNQYTVGLNKFSPIALSFGHSVISSSHTMRSQVMRQISMQMHQEATRARQNAIFENYALDQAFQTLVRVEEINGKKVVTIQGEENNDLTNVHKSLQNFNSQIDSNMLSQLMALEVNMSKQLIEYLKQNPFPDDVDSWFNLIISILDQIDHSAVGIAEKKYLFVKIIERLGKIYAANKLQITDDSDLNIAKGLIGKIIDRFNQEMFVKYDEMVLKAYSMNELLKFYTQGAILDRDKQNSVLISIISQIDLSDDQKNEAYELIQAWSLKDFDRLLTEINQKYKLGLTLDIINKLLLKEVMVNKLVPIQEIDYVQPNSLEVSRFIKHRLDLLRHGYAQKFLLSQHDVQTSWIDRGWVSPYEINGQVVGYYFSEGFSLQKVKNSSKNEVVFAVIGGKQWQLTSNDQELIIFWEGWEAQAEQRNMFLERIRSFEVIQKNVINETPEQLENYLTKALSKVNKSSFFDFDIKVFLKEVVRFYKMKEGMKDNIYPLIVFKDEEVDFRRRNRGFLDKLAEGEMGKTAKGKSVVRQVANFGMYLGGTKLTRLALGHRKFFGSGFLPDVVGSSVAVLFDMFVLTPNADTKMFKRFYEFAGAYMDEVDFVGAFLPSSYIGSRIEDSLTSVIRHGLDIEEGGYDEKSVRAAMRIADIPIKFAVDTASMRIMGASVRGTVSFFKEQAYKTLLKKLKTDGFSALRMSANKVRIDFFRDGVKKFVDITFGKKGLEVSGEGAKSFRDLIKKDGKALGGILAVLATTNVLANLGSESLGSDTLVGLGSDLGLASNIYMGHSLLKSFGVASLGKSTIYGAILIELIKTISEESDGLFGGDYGSSGRIQSLETVAYKTGLMALSTLAAYGLCSLVHTAGTSAIVVGGVIIYRGADWAVQKVYDNSILQGNNAERLLNDNLPFVLRKKELSSRDYQTVLIVDENREILDYLRAPLHKQKLKLPDVLQALILNPDFISDSSGIVSKTLSEYSIAELLKMAGVTSIVYDHERHLRVSLLVAILERLMSQNIKGNIEIDISSSNTINANPIFGSASFIVKIRKDGREVASLNLRISGDHKMDDSEDSTVEDVILNQDENFVFAGWWSISAVSSISVENYKKWYDFFVESNAWHKRDTLNSNALLFFRAIILSHLEWMIADESRNPFGFSEEYISVILKIRSAVMQGRDPKLNSKEINIAVKILKEFYKKWIDLNIKTIPANTIISQTEALFKTFCAENFVVFPRTIITEARSLRGLYRMGFVEKRYDLLKGKEVEVISGFEEFDEVLTYLGINRNFSLYSFRVALRKAGVIDRAGFIKTSYKNRDISSIIIGIFSEKRLTIDSDQAEFISGYLRGRLTGNVSLLKGLLNVDISSSLQTGLFRKELVGLSAIQQKWLSSTIISLRSRDSLSWSFGLLEQNQDFSFDEKVIVDKFIIILKALESSNLKPEDKINIQKYIRRIVLLASFSSNKSDEYSKFETYLYFYRGKSIEYLSKESLADLYVEFIFYSQTMMDKKIQQDRLNAGSRDLVGTPLRNYPVSLRSFVLARQNCFDVSLKREYEADSYEYIPKDEKVLFDAFLKKHGISKENDKLYGLLFSFLDSKRIEYTFYDIFSLFLVSRFLEEYRNRIDSPQENELPPQLKQAYYEYVREKKDGYYLTPEALRNICSESERVLFVLNVLEQEQGFLYLIETCSKDRDTLAVVRSNLRIQHKLIELRAQFNSKLEQLLAEFKALDLNNLDIQKSQQLLEQIRLYQKTVSFFNQLINTKKT